MTATNHALTGALIGLTVTNPWLALPLAFLSHFALDAIPHYDGHGTVLERLSAPRYRWQLLAEASACGLIVLTLFLAHPAFWWLGALAAFAAASPDLFWIPKFIVAQTKHRLMGNNNWFWRFHHIIQWRTGPQYWWIEVLWGLVAVSILLPRL